DFAVGAGGSHRRAGCAGALVVNGHRRDACATPCAATCAITYATDGDQRAHWNGQLVHEHAEAAHGGHGADDAQRLNTRGGLHGVREHAHGLVPETGHGWTRMDTDGEKRNLEKRNAVGAELAEGAEGMGG